MNRIFSVLKHYHTIDEKEEEILKEEIKKCIEIYKNDFIKNSRLLVLNENTLLKIYAEINVQHLSHLIVFYSFLIIKNTENDLITLLTVHSLDDFIKYKKELNFKNISFSKQNEYFYIFDECIKASVVSLSYYATGYFVDSMISFVCAIVK